MTNTTSPQPESNLSQGSVGLRGFWSLIVTQFQGAFSDNALKNLVVFLILTAGYSEAGRHRVGEQVNALFALPFILFSMAGGFLADRFSKRTITIGVKVFEIFVMLFATVGLAVKSLPMQLAAVFMMGTHSAFFGPSKYGSLPELLPEKRLSWGNGVLELGTFMAIILGTVASGFLAEHLRGRQWVSGLILVGLAMVGLSTSLGISRVPAADPQRRFRWNFVAELFRRVRAMRGDQALTLALWGNTYFFFLAALLQLNLIFYGADVLHLNETRIGLLNVALALGIGTGSLAAGYLSGGKIEYGLIPIGALGLAAAAAALAVPGISFSQAAVRLALLGFAGGFFIVPICALLQHRPAKERKGAVLASANLLSFAGVFLASAAHYVCTRVLHLTPGNVFFVGTVLTLAATIYTVWLLPDSLLRLVLWIVTRTVYRIKIVGRDNIPEKSGALFVCNHLSYVDALLLLASTDRHIRFMMYKGIYDRPYIKPFARVLKIIPISADLRPREMIQSLRTAGDAIKSGQVVCIFAEGQMTRIGQLLPFRRGFERIMRGVEAPIIPVALEGVWGSIFSFEKGRFVWKMPRHFPFPVTVAFGKPMPTNSKAFEVRQAVQELMAAAWGERRKRMRTLHRAFVRTARVVPFRFAMADGQGTKLTFAGALTRTVFLARRLKKVWAGQEMVGLLLLPSVPGALVNFAALLCGKVPVNLNYTLSSEALASCARQCELKTVLTSRAFLERVKIQVPCETVFLEDVAAKPVASEKLAAFFMAWFLPVGLLERVLSCGTGSAPSGAADSAPAVGTTGWREGAPANTRGRACSPFESARRAGLDDIATVIFSSGSTGDPKGVMLSHYNIGSNIEQLGQVFGFGARDRILGVLPFFHSFGFTGALALPAALGVGVAYHANPLDAKTVGRLVQEHAVTFLLGTPTFLQIYLRGCAPEQFGSLRFVAAGAEKLPERIAVAFEERFGIRPFEAYGCTECAPAVTVSTRDFRAPGFRQVGAKRGKIGHPLPGVSVRIVDPVTFTPLPVGAPGLLLVRGPNVMQGYLGKPEKTAEVLRDGWYVTGDVAALDEDGFLQITDRLSRFSKIGGEMVPHIKVEEKLHELAGAMEQTFVVTSVSDDRKGERLVVLHKLPEGQLQPCLEKLAQSDLPNLWKPRPDQFFRVEAFPLLGSGKLDLRKVREQAAHVAGASL